MELLVGRVEKCKNSRVLVIHNKTLTGRIKEFNQKVNLKKNTNGIEVEPLGKFHVTIAAQRKLRITATQLIKEGIVKIENKNQVKIFVNLKKWGITKKELFSKGKGSPLTSEIPENLVKKRGAIRKGQRTYYLDISSKSLYGIAKNEKIKCLFNRIEDDIVIINSENKEARKMTPHSKKRVQIAIPKEILTKKEIFILNSKSWLPINIQLNLASFKLETKDFFSVKEEKELVEFLNENNVEIKIKDPSDPFDFLIDNKIAIEIHNSAPKYGDLVTRHKVRSGMVRLRILEADFLTKGKEISKFFVVLNREWEKSEYVRELLNKINDKTIVLFTDFKDNWSKNVGEEIIKSIE